MTHAFRRRAWLAALIVVLGLPVPAVAGPARFLRFAYDGRDGAGLTVGPGQYANPILAGYYPDPSVLRVGDDYYLVNSSFAHFPGIPVFHSRDLVTWTQIGNAIDRPEQLDLSSRAVSEGVFAPDISWHDGVFYIINTCVGCRGNFVVTARNPAGPWSDPVWLSFEGIDPSIYWEGDRAFVVNNRAPAGPPRYEGHRALWLQEYDWRAGRMVGDSVQLVDGGVDPAAKPVWIEGPHIFRRGRHYYLIAAEGGTGDQHSEVVFRADRLRGPYRPGPANPILTQRGLPADRPHPVTSAGHADVVRTPGGQWWATFLATRPYRGDLYNTGRETFLLPVAWKGGWPRILPPGVPVPLVAARPALPPAPRPTTGDVAYVERFDRPTLGPEWIGVRTPREGAYRLEGGALVLDRGATLGDRAGTPAFVGRRQQHRDATVTTTLVYAPEREGDRAGLAAIQNDDAFLFFGVTLAAGRPMVALYIRAEAAPERMVAAAPLAAGASQVTLSLAITGGTLAASYDDGAGRRPLAADVDATFLSTARAGGFVGTVIGPYAMNR